MKRLIIMTCLILTGCTATRHEQLSNLGFTRHYLDGYQDGCHSQRTNGQTYHDGYRQDPERMNRKLRYAQGWNDGFEQCDDDDVSYY
ncbi:TPA: hypothetical protein ACX6PH_001086 [Photobacterium damselae]